MNNRTKYVLQLCHCYNMPFLDVARQYASLFKDTEYHIVTVYLTGAEDNEVIKETNSDTVLFLNNSSKDLRGLKRQQIKQIQKLYQQYDFEFGIGHRFKAIYILCHIKNLPVIGIHHAFSVYSRFMRRFFINRHRKNLLLLGVSNAIRDDIKKHLPTFPQQQIQTLYNRIDIKQMRENLLDRFEARKQLGIAQDKYVFANVGRLHPDKSQRTLITAFAQVAEKLPNSVLVILGKGKLEQALRQQAQQLDIVDRVLFLGVIPQAANYFRAFDSFVLSSDHEPFGMVLLEAIIAELPTIATDAGGAKEIINDPQWLFAVNDSKKLSELMLNVYSLDDNQKRALNEKNITHLQHNFTDNSVKDIFWQLPFIKSFL
jgi:glycosyltransferase involved in cell wall biosynthesis